MSWFGRRWVTVLFLMCCCAAHAEDKRSTTASLSGTITGATASVAVHLEPMIESPMRYYDGYETDSQANGAFSFTFIPPGEYRLSVEAPGFTVTLPGTVASGTISLHAGEERKGIAIQLSHRLSICGHVTEDRSPIDAWGRHIGSDIEPADTFVTYYRYNAAFDVMEEERKVGTDKDGSFRITDLAPGTYYLTDAGTWYPNSKGFWDAKPVVVGTDAITTCTTDMLLQGNQYRTTATLTVNILGAAGNENFIEIGGTAAPGEQQYRVAILERNAEGVRFMTPLNFGNLYQPKSTEGSMTFQTEIGTSEVVLVDKDHAEPNLWRDAPTQRIIFDTQEVDLKLGDKKTVELVPRPMAMISGEVHLEQTTRREFCPDCQNVFVSILRDGNGEFQSVALDKDNKFTFYNVTPGKYQIFINASRPDRVFLESVSVDGVVGEGRSFYVAEPKEVTMSVTLSGDGSKAMGHLSPDERHWQRWEAESLRPKATLAGRITGGDGQAYTVRLLPVRYNSNELPVGNVMSEADGSFRFEDVPAGAYRLQAYGKDYVRFDYGAEAPETHGTVLLIAAGGDRNDLEIRAPKYSSICGVATQPNGDPPPYDRRLWYRAANRRDYGQPPQINLEKDGSFRIDGLLAGDYTLEIPYYEVLASKSGEGKLLVHVPQGKNVGCDAGSPVQIPVPVTTMVTTRRVTYVVSGSVQAELPARLGDRFVVQLEDANSESYAYTIRQQELSLAADHSFSFDKVRPGSYLLRVYGVYGPEPKPLSPIPMRSFSGSTSGLSGNTWGGFPELRHLVAEQPLTVSDADVSGVVVKQLLVLPTVTGTVHILKPPPQWKDFKASDMSVRLLPHHKNGPVDAKLTDEGGFSIGAVDAGEYEVEMQASKPSRYIQSYVLSARLNGKEINPRFLTLAAVNSATLELTVSSEMATVNVHLKPDTKFPRAAEPLGEDCRRDGPRYEAVLLPMPFFSADVDQEPLQMPQLYTTRGISCRAPLDGQIQSVPPGQYMAIAGENVSAILMASSFMRRNQTTSPEMRKMWAALMPLGKTVTVHAGETVELTLEETTLEAAQTAARLKIADEYEDLRPPNPRCCLR
jgi:hypothetical protein